MRWSLSLNNRQFLDRQDITISLFRDGWISPGIIILKLSTPAQIPYRYVLLPRRSTTSEVNLRDIDFSPPNFCKALCVLPIVKYSGLMPTVTLSPTDKPSDSAGTSITGGQTFFWTYSN